MGAFYTPPPNLELDDLANRVAARVVDMYSTVEAELIYQIARRVTRDLPANPELAAQLAVIRDLQATARHLLDRIPPDLAEQVVRIATEQGTAAAAQTMPFTEGMPTYSGITRTAADTLALVAQDLGNAFNQVHLRILRYPVDAMGFFIGTDVYQQTVARHAGSRTLGALTTDQTRRRALADFLNQGIPGFVDKANRQWRIGSYTEMAVRSSTARAFIDAGTARMGRAGARFITVLGNNDACPLCAAWFGKVLSIDGTPAGVYEVEHTYLDGVMVTVEVAATLDDARAQGLHHPNCACQHAAYYPGLTKATVAAHHDPAAWEASQRQRALERRIRHYKRKIGVAEATGADTDRIPGWKSRIRDSQAEIRQIVDEHGRHRKYAREQVAWADGNPTDHAQPPVLPTVAPAPDTTGTEHPARVSLNLT